VIISDKIYINKSELGEHLQGLCDLFIYNNPEYYQKKKLKLSVANVFDKLYHYQFDGITLSLPRGSLDKVKQYYKEHNLLFRAADKRISYKPINIKLHDTIIEPQQRQIMDLLINNGGGCVEMAMGGGKSIAILGLISEIKQPTIILLHEHRLLTQWKEEIEKRLKGKFKLGQLHGDIKEEGDITLGLIQTVHRMFDEDVHCLDKYGMIIVDEMHRVNSDTYIKVINNVPAKYRIGVTGTIDRKDGKEILSFDMIGKPLIKIGAHDIKHRITNFRFEIINTNIPIEIPYTERWTGQRREPVIDFTKTLTVLTQNDERNSIIISKVIDAIKEGHICLILSDRVEHNKNMHKMLTEMGIMCILLIGETRKKVKWDEIRNDTSVQCIVANTSIASEGLDLPRLSALFLTCPSSNYPKLSQRVGRIRRHVDGKQLPVLYDFVDNLAYSSTVNGKSYLLKHIARKRIKLYQKLIDDYNNGKTETL
jgi:superfamily II DNA or RNA helicase